MQFEHMIRMGTHSEKDYLLKACPWYDEIILNANLVEASSSALAVFLAVLEKNFVVDPVTYAFALDPDMLARNNVPARDARTARALKRTFQSLARHYGPPIELCAGVRPLEPTDFGEGVCERLSERVIEYQVTRLAEAARKSDDFLGVTHGPTELRPSRTIAPYFFTADRNWLAVNIKLLASASEMSRDKGTSIWGMINLDSRHIDDPVFRDEILRSYGSQECAGFLLWLSDFGELNASRGQILGLQELVKGLATTGRPVINAYGGYYSALLYEDGMCGISHGIGYGERRSIEPVVGGGLPPARFYLPRLHYQINMAQFASLISSRGSDGEYMKDEEYIRDICRCVICTGLLRKGIAFLLEEYTQSNPRMVNGRLREFATPFVYNLTRYHFLHNRFMELRDLVGGTSRSELLKSLTLAVEEFRPTLGVTSTGFAKVWAEALK